MPAQERDRILHLVCGLPASGKTTYARQLAAETGAVLLDSDTASDLLIQAAHLAAGIDPHDRDSPTYKTTYRLPVYETLFALATENLPHAQVIIAGPFTSELQERTTWQAQLESRFPDTTIQIHHLQIEETERLRRMDQRAAPRDAAKRPRDPQITHEHAPEA